MAVPCLAALAALLVLAIAGLAVSGERIRQEERREPISVPCSPEKCRMLHLWNEIPGLIGDEDTRLRELQRTLITDPPGLVRSLDREEALKELISGGEKLVKIYREMLELERK